VEEAVMELLFVEAGMFTRQIVKLGLEEELADLQWLLRQNPRAGVVEPGTCGMRKVRIGDPWRGQGKRFGARVHYAFSPREESIYLMGVFRKNEQATLSPEQKKALCRRLRAWGAE
jgi:hypothetical protein